MSNESGCVDSLSLSRLMRQGRLAASGAELVALSRLWVLNNIGRRCYKR